MSLLDLFNPVKPPVAKPNIVHWMGNEPLKDRKDPSEYRKNWCRQRRLKLKAMKAKAAPARNRKTEKELKAKKAERDKRYRKANKEKIAATSKAWYDRNKESRREYERRRRSRQRAQKQSTASAI